MAIQAKIIRITLDAGCRGTQSTDVRFYSHGSLSFSVIWSFMKVKAAQTIIIKVVSHMCPDKCFLLLWLHSFPGAKFFPS